MEQNEMLTQVAKDLSEVEPKIKHAEELIQALKEAGEGTASMESDLRNLKARRDKWKRMLVNRGYR